MCFQLITHSISIFVNLCISNFADLGFPGTVAIELEVYHASKITHISKTHEIKTKFYDEKYIYIYCSLFAQLVIVSSW